ncbi:MAG: hypothetical protein JNJ83_00475 [Verrucomicrobiaceae bacterium]|nr:hypothetical protein [Verrucomicrobiaceae bacterium]
MGKRKAESRLKRTLQLGTTRVWVSWSGGFSRGGEGGTHNKDCSRTDAALASAIENTSANTNAVTTLDMNPEVDYDPNQLLLIIQKLNELILTARR